MINLCRKQWGGALVVSLLALSLALAGCSDAPVEGSDITGTWTRTEDSTTYTYVFASDGSATYTDSSKTGSDEKPVEFTGSWSLNGTTLTVSVSGTYENASCTISETYTVVETGNTQSLVLKSGSMTAGSATTTYPDENTVVSLQRSTNT